VKGVATRSAEPSANRLIPAVPGGQMTAAETPASERTRHATPSTSQSVAPIDSGADADRSQHPKLPYCSFPGNGDSPKPGAPSQCRILRYLQYGGATPAEISEALDIPIDPSLYRRLKKLRRERAILTDRGRVYITGRGREMAREGYVPSLLCSRRSLFGDGAPSRERETRSVACSFRTNEPFCLSLLPLGEGLHHRLRLASSSATFNAFSASA
jgi:hypothetical protein